MNILFLTLMKIKSYHDHGIYPDLIREFLRHGHNVYAVTPHEISDFSVKNPMQGENGVYIIEAPIYDYYNQSVIKKGISVLTIGSKYVKAIKKNCKDIKFDLILYSTPPVTFNSIIKKYKKKNGARTYLLLKDIWPQGPADMGALSKTGIKGLAYKLFRRQEKELYAISDNIGCMSHANVDYVLSHNPEIEKSKVEICPNSIEVFDKSVDEEMRKSIRLKYGIPIDKMVFVYGGNLGKPQGVPFIIECIKKCRDLEDVFFLIVGSGTEYHVIEDYVNVTNQKNLKLMPSLPKDEYDTIVAACDVGLIFLDHRFTIPNFPSRLLVYIAAKLPVLACTDTNTDIGKVVTEGGFGWWCESDNSDQLVNIIRKIVNMK